MQQLTADELAKLSTLLDSITTAANEAGCEITNELTLTAPNGAMLRTVWHDGALALDLTHW